MSIPNLLAVTRLTLTPIVMVMILRSPGHRGLAIAGAIVFGIAALTDFADGYLARRWRITTTLGAFLDTVADKVLVGGTLIALVEIGTTTTWIAFIIIGREIAMMGLRSVAALDLGTVPPSLWGKWKATVQFLAVLFAIGKPDVDLGPFRLDEWLMGVAVVVTVVSAGDYFSRFRAVLSPRDRAE
jgi:CDP-diacylglycerol--glycerol-3-phosphate 3-phosphatidyltransferase